MKGPTGAIWCKGVCKKGSLDVASFAPKAWTSCCLFVSWAGRKLNQLKEDDKENNPKVGVGFLMSQKKGGKTETVTFFQLH